MSKQFIHTSVITRLGLNPNSRTLFESTFPQHHNDFSIGDSLPRGDCFFDTMAQLLNQLEDAETYTAKSLRELIDAYAKVPNNQDRWLRDTVESEGQNFNDYLARIAFTADEMLTHNLNQTLTGLAVWGRAHIEGKIICECLQETYPNLTLHLTEIQDPENAIQTGVPIIHQKINATGSQSLEDPLWDMHEQPNQTTLHLICARLHFVPLLKKNLFIAPSPVTQPMLQPMMVNLPTPNPVTTTEAIWRFPTKPEDYVHIPDAKLIENTYMAFRESRVVVLHGPEGVGKTHLAQLCCEHADHINPNIQFIAWIAGGDADTVQRNFIDLGLELGIIPYGCPPEEALIKTKSHFEDHANWLLVFDNIKDPNWLIDCLPAGNGYCLITSTEAEWPNAHTIPVDEMTMKNAEMLLNLQGDYEKEDALNELARQLGGLPLTLKLAGHYLAKHPLDNDTVVHYQLAYATIFSRFDDLPFDATHHTLAIALLTSIEALKSTSPHAIKLLQAMRFFRCTDIPYRLLTRLLDTNGHITEHAQTALDTGLSDLARYGLITPDDELDQCHLHPMIHHILQWSGWVNDTLITRQQVITAIKTDIDQDIVYTLNIILKHNTYLPHLLELATYDESRKKALLALMDIHTELQKFDLSIHDCQQLLELSNTDKEKAFLYNTLGHCYTKLSDWRLAIQAYENAIQHLDDPLQIANCCNAIANRLLSDDPDATEAAETYYNMTFDLISLQTDPDNKRKTVLDRLKALNPGKYEVQITVTEPRLFKGNKRTHGEDGDEPHAKRKKRDPDDTLSAPRTSCAM